MSCLQDIWNDYDSLINQKDLQRKILSLAAHNSKISIADINPQDVKETVTDKRFTDNGLEYCTTTTFDIKITIISDFPVCKIGNTEIKLDLDGDHYSKIVDYTLLNNTWDIVVNTLLPDGQLGTSYKTIWR